MLNFIIGTIFFIVFGAIIAVIFAPVWLPIYAVFSKNKLSDFQRKMNINILFTFMLIALLITAITPINEYMSCDEDLVCTIHTEYQIALSNKLRSIKINNNSYLGVIEEHHVTDYSRRKHSYHVVKYYNNKKDYNYKDVQNSDLEPIMSDGPYDYVDYYLALNKKQLFTAISASSKPIFMHDDVIMQDKIKEFELYKKNPKQKFYIRSLLNRERLNIRLFWCSLIMVILFLINRNIDIKNIFEDIMSIVRMIN